MTELDEYGDWCGDSTVVVLGRDVRCNRGTLDEGGRDLSAGTTALVSTSVWESPADYMFIWPTDEAEQPLNMAWIARDDLTRFAGQEVVQPERTG